MVVWFVNLFDILGDLCWILITKTTSLTRLTGFRLARKF